MVHVKTGRPGSPFQTADLAAQVAQILDDPELPPDLCYRVTLVHDVGYLELPNTVFTLGFAAGLIKFSLIKLDVHICLLYTSRCV